MRAVVFQEGEWWVGQCLEKDIAVQARTEQEVLDEFRRTFDVYKELKYSIDNHPTTPPSVIQQIPNMGKTIEIGEYLL